MTTPGTQPQPDTADAGEPWPKLEPVHELPVLLLEVHNRCNCRCTMCDIWKRRDTEGISARVVERWIGDWLGLGVRRVVLTGGEPLMSPDWGELCRLVRRAGIDITLLSTGLLLEAAAAEVVRHVDDVIVSLDGPPVIHDRIRAVPHAFDRLAAGVRAVRKLGPQVNLSARCTVQRQNFRELRAVVHTSKELRLDRISFLAADVSTEAFNRPGSWSAARASEIALQLDELPRLEAELDALEQEHAEDLASGFIAEPASKLRRRLLGHFQALAGIRQPVAPECNAPWVSAVIEPDGTVRPCFFQPSIGNVLATGSLSEVVGSRAARDFRANLDVASNPICRRCVCSLNLRRPAP